MDKLTTNMIIALIKYDTVVSELFKELNRNSAADWGVVNENLLFCNKVLKEAKEIQK